MFIFRFPLSLIVLLYTANFVFATPEITHLYTKPLSNIGLRNPIRLPIFYDDASNLRFVSRSTPLTEISYTPTDLVTISGSSINQAGRNSILRIEARDALWELASAFQKKYNIPLTVIS